MSALSQDIQLAGGFQPNPVLVDGDGPPTVYLHGLLGQEWGPFLDGLAAGRRVYAPAHAGSDEPDELQHLDHLYDLVLYYDDLFNALGLEQIDLIGHSFGGMVAAEIAAAYPGRVRRLILIDPLGLWRDDAPVEDYLLVPPERQTALLLGDPSREEVIARVKLPDDPKARIAAQLRRTTALASASHFIWPIPERGLAKRLRRVSAETLIVWGADDKLVPSSYAQEFATLIASSQVEIVAGAGHSPQLEQCQAVLDKVRLFLDR